MSECCWKNGTKSRDRYRVATNLQFVKKKKKRNATSDEAQLKKKKSATKRGMPIMAK